MDPQVATSFIPKEALTVERERGTVGLFLLVAIFLFVVSIIAAGGVVAYTQYLSQQLASSKQQLDIDKGAFDPATIQELVRLDSRIEQSKVLMAAHLAPSAIFDLLAQTTLVNVQFTSFSYQNSGDKATLTLDGTADSFATLALQSDAFSKTSMLKDVIFSDIGINPGGSVSFTVNATIDPSLLSYSKQVANTTAPAGSIGTTTTQ